MKLNNRILAECFWWFAVVCGIFGVVTEISGQQVYLSSYFYLELAIVGFLGGIFVSLRDK